MVTESIIKKNLILADTWEKNNYCITAFKDIVMFHKKSYHYCQQKVSPSNNKNGLVANHSFSAYTLLQRVIIGLLQ